MSRKGNGWDKACRKTLFGSLQVQRWHGQRFHTRQQARNEVLDGRHWYNGKRLPSTLNYVSPMEYEREWKHRAAQETSGQTGFREEAVEKRES